MVEPERKFGLLDHVEKKCTRCWLPTLLSSFCGQKSMEVLKDEITETVSIDRVREETEFGIGYEFVSVLLARISHDKVPFNSLQYFQLISIIDRSSS